MRPPVNSKADFARRYARGEFGNASPTWDSVRDWTADPNGHGTKGWNGPKLYHLRNRVPGGETYYNLTCNELLATLPRLTESIEHFYVSEMCPTELTIFQGYFTRDEAPGFLPPRRRHWVGNWTTVAKPMRTALNEECAGKTMSETTGLETKIVLQQYLCHNSYGWLIDLFDEYPGHTVELTSLSTNWGTLRGYNTVFWEVRNY